VPRRLAHDLRLRLARPRGLCFRAAARVASTRAAP
jgi:hypothetical protein